MEGNHNSETNLLGNDYGALLQAVPTSQRPQVRRRVFVTVGSSPDARFDDLVKTVLTPKCLLVLKKKGYTSLVIQHGHGPYLPTKMKSKAYDFFQIEHFGTGPNIEELINDNIYAASLVISYAGAESVFKILRAPRPLVVVLNNHLLDEYEPELTKQLSKYMYCCNPETLVETLSSMDVEARLPNPPTSPSPPPPFHVFTDLVNSLQHFQAKPMALGSQVWGRVFVTVGSNPEARFDDLVQTVLTPKCLRALKKCGYTSLVIQHGNGSFLPTKSKAYNSFQVEHFGSRPNIEKLISDHIYAASLVISFIGAASIFKTLRAPRPLVVVLNNQLLGEFGLELAKKLSKFMYCCGPETLVETLSIMKAESLLPYPPHEPPFNVLAELVNALRDFLPTNKFLAPLKEIGNPTSPKQDSKIVDPKLPVLEPTSDTNKQQTNLKLKPPKDKK